VIFAAGRVIEGTRLVLAERSAWTKRAEARDRHGHPVAYDDPRAVRWCLTAALLRASDALRASEATSRQTADMQRWGLQAALAGVAHALGLELGIYLNWGEPSAVEPATFGRWPSVTVRIRDAGSVLTVLNDAQPTRYQTIRAALERSSSALTVLGDQDELDALVVRVRELVEAADRAHHASALNAPGASRGRDRGTR
jgi:hypothetical protein